MHDSDDTSICCLDPTLRAAAALVSLRWFRSPRIRNRRCPAWGAGRAATWRRQPPTLSQPPFSSRRPVGRVRIAAAGREQPSRSLQCSSSRRARPREPWSSSMQLPAGSDYREGYYGRALSSAGYAVLAIDTYAPRQVTYVERDGSKLSTYAQALDAFAARKYLISLGYPPDRMAVMGTGRGGTIALLAADRTFVRNQKDRFDLAMPISAGCIFHPRKAESCIEDLHGDRRARPDFGRGALSQPGGTVRRRWRQCHREDLSRCSERLRRPPCGREALRRRDDGDIHGLHRRGRAGWSINLRRQDICRKRHEGPDGGNAQVLHQARRRRVDQPDSKRPTSRSISSSFST